MPQEKTDFAVFCENSKIARILRGVGPARPSTEQRPARPLTERSRERPSTEQSAARPLTERSSVLPNTPPSGEISEIGNGGAQLVPNHAVQQMYNILEGLIKTVTPKDNHIVKAEALGDLYIDLRVSSHAPEPPNFTQNTNVGGGGWGGGWGGGVCCIACGGMLATASVSIVVSMMTAAYFFDRSPIFSDQ